LAAAQQRQVAAMKINLIFLPAATGLKLSDKAAAEGDSVSVGVNWVD
jgi:hypothetical protein